MGLLHYYFKPHHPTKPSTWHFALIKTKSMGKLFISIN